MTKEQESIEIIYKYLNFNEICGTRNFKDALEIVLSMLKEKDKEIENLKDEKDKAWEEWNNLEQGSYEEEKRLKAEIKEKDRQIDLMAEQLAGLTIWNNEKEEPLILGDKEEIKQYFERKSEE